MDKAISLIIPAYNEEDRLDATLQTALAYLAENYPHSEVLVMDDGSPDKTAEIAAARFAQIDRSAKVSARVISYQPNRGKGYAVRVGLLAARHPVALFSDADLSTPITETPKIVEPIFRGEYDVVFGSRALDRSLIGTHQPWRREQGGRVVNLLVRLATRLPFWDTQCGFKAFRMEICRPVVEAAVIDRFGFDVELLYVAHLAGLRLLEHPVRWDHFEGSKLDPVRDGLRIVSEVRQIRQQARKGFYTEAIRQTREARQRLAERVQAGASPAPDESDVSPELAGAARRI
ncbi:MAG TPA: dolichyl-phosphate beta-glucosyltransferase [Pyrinomonadaceae bacterium]|jgi:glycosyltransferase involved in cell wall biosynthesis|nr:dolichyl-phosphate beta-glucosyltransferase [Pyrinomonadaceae bacterium]